MSVIDHTGIQLACRNRAINSLTVATTGSTSLSTTSTGYARASGSFITDGFVPGMEMVATGFAAGNNTARVITQVVTGFITTATAPDSVQGAASGRTITVGLPASRAWENIKLVPVPGTPWVEEQYIPGPSTKITLSRTGEIELTPMYQLQIHVPEDTGISANGRYADAITDLYSPISAFTTSSSIVVQVRSDVGPFRGQRQQSFEGFSVIPITIPLRCRIPNVVAA